MKARYLLVGLVLVTAMLTYIGVGYREKRRRALLTVQLEKALDDKDEARAIHLLRLGADANGKEGDGTPFIFGANGTSLLKAFIAAGANVNVEYSPAKGKRLTLLARERTWDWPESNDSDQLEEMKCLLEAGADPNRGTVSVLANSAGGCGEACWCNPREIALLLQHGAKLRQGDAAAILEAALDGDDTDEDNGPHLLRLWATLPVPVQERRALLRNAIKRFAGGSYTVESDEKYRLQTLAFLRHELRKMQTGSQHR